MLDLASSLDPRAALGVHAAVAVAVIAFVLAFAFLLREKRAPGAGYGLYESGAPDVTPVAHRVPTTYFLIAACFVIFDLEAAILFAWAVAAPAAGWPGLISAAIFICVLLAALAYLWADGALDVGPRPRGAGSAAHDAPGETR